MALQQKNPWDNDPIVGIVQQSAADTLGRPVIVPNAKPAPIQGKSIVNGYVVDPNNATATQIKGLPPEAVGERLSPEALDAETTNWLLTGKMSPLGMGAGPLRVQIENNRPQLMKKYGIGDNQLPAIQKQFDADSKAYSARTQQLSLMNQALDAAKEHVEQITGYLNDLPAQTDLTPLNAVSLAAQRATSGKTVTNLDATIPLLQGEIAKIMTANPQSGAGQLTDEARREFDILNSSRSPAARKEAMQALMEMVNRKITGTQAESDRLNQRLNGGLASYAVGPSSGSAPPASLPGLGAVPPVDVSPITNGTVDVGPQLTPSDGDTKTVVDPKLQALGGKIVALMEKGADKNTIMGFAIGASPALRGDPKFKAWIDEAISYRKDHPGAKFAVDPRFYTSEVPLSASEKVATAVGQSVPGAAFLNAGDAATAGNFGRLTGTEDATNRALAVANAQHPVASLAGGMAGGTAAALGGEAALGRLGLAAGPLRALLADAGYGAAAGATNSDDAASGALKGLLLGAGGNLAGRGIAKGLGSAVSGVTNPVTTSVARDVPLTVGQAVGQSGALGRAVKGIEDRLSGIPVVGDAINARRIEGLQQMNSKAFDRALEPIGGKAGGKFGEEAVQNAQDQVSRAFRSALGGKSASVDRPFVTEAATAKRAIQALPPSVAKDVENHVDTAIRDYFDPATLTISGDNMQGLLRDLQQVKGAYRNDPAGHRVGRAIDQVSASVENLFRRQSPDVMPQYDAAKTAFRRVSTLEDAVLRAKNTNGIFTPGQLGLSDRANTVKFGGKHAAASGKGEFHDFQRNMQEVLPNKVPDSGTAGRVLVPAALIGAGAGGGELSGDATTGLTLGTLLALAYSRTGQRALTAAVLKRPGAVRAAGSVVRKGAPFLGHGAGTRAALDGSRE